MSTPIVAAPQVWLGSLPLCATDSAGVDWVVTNLAGWSGSAAPTLSVVQRGADHGGWGGTSWLQARQLTLTVYVIGPTRGAMLAALDTLNAAASLSPTPLRVLEDGGLDRTMQVRRNGEVVTTVTGVSALVSIPMIAEDPRKYSTSAHTGVCHLPSVTGGLAFPIAFPIAFNAVVSSGQIQVSNAGTIASAPLQRIYGPVQQPIVTLQRSDGTIQQLTYNATLSSTDYLDLDCGAHTAVLDETASRRGLVSGDWPMIPPGQSATLAFSAGAYSSAAQLAATWYDTWM